MAHPLVQSIGLDIDDDRNIDTDDAYADADADEDDADADEHDRKDGGRESIVRVNRLIH